MIHFVSPGGIPGFWWSSEVTFVQKRRIVLIVRVCSDVRFLRKRVKTYETCETRAFFARSLAPSRAPLFATVSRQWAFGGSASGLLLRAFRKSLRVCVLL